MRVRKRGLRGFETPQDLQTATASVCIFKINVADDSAAAEHSLGAFSAITET